MTTLRVDAGNEVCTQDVDEVGEEKLILAVPSVSRLLGMATPQRDLAEICLDSIQDGHRRRGGRRRRRCPFLQPLPLSGLKLVQPTTAPEHKRPNGQIQRRRRPYRARIFSYRPFDGPLQVDHAVVLGGTSQPRRCPLVSIQVGGFLTPHLVIDREYEPFLMIHAVRSPDRVKERDPLILWVEINHRAL
jgi:hypothetical protein